MAFDDRRSPVTVTIPTAADGLQITGQDLGESQIVGFIMPAAWTGNEVSFQISIDGENYFDLYDEEGVEVVIDPVLINRAYGLGSDINRLLCAQFVKLRAGRTGFPEQQGDPRIITLITRRLA